MDKPYSVSLQGIEGLPPAEAVAADVRFIKALERALGSSDAVVEVYRAWLEASESDATEISSKVWALATQWPKAFQTAQQAGLKNIGECEGHFELHLDRQPVESA
jgi:hypothetical protein